MHSYSLLKAIKNHGYDGSILTTYNCHIPFIEEVVIRKLASVGCRHNIVLADHSQLNAAFENHLPKRVGRDYILLPIKQKTAFHPKIILLAGKNKGFLAIGSHNLTYSGFSYNREITNVFTYQEKKQ